jgi:hypothetical protein
MVRSRESNNFLGVGSLVNPPAVTGVPSTTAGGVLITPADTQYTKQDISIRSNIKLTGRITLILGYLYEKFDVSDWQYQNLPLVGGTAIAQSSIFLGTNLQNYVAHVGSFVVKYKF